MLDWRNLVYALDLGSKGEIREGSSPSLSTMNKREGLYWYIPDSFFNPNSETPNKINKIYRSSLGSSMDEKLE